MLDSNIWLYAFIDQDAPLKQTIARNLLRQQMSVVVSTQIINEVCFNLLRKARFTEKQIGRMVTERFINDTRLCQSTRSP